LGLDKPETTLTPAFAALTQGPDLLCVSRATGDRLRQANLQANLQVKTLVRSLRNLAVYWDRN
jgi:hypothetical protein